MKCLVVFTIFLEQRQERLFRILVHNSLEGELYTRFKQYVKVQILEIMDTIDFSDHNGLPNSIMGGALLQHDSFGSRA